LVGDRGGQEAIGHTEGGTNQTTRISGTVHAFMVIARKLRHSLKTGDLAKYPHRQVRMQPHPLEFARGQRLWLGPDLIRYPDAAQIMNVARAPHQCHRVGVQACNGGRRRHQVGPPLVNAQG
jgi:hypothetical protein